MKTLNAVNSKRADLELSLEDELAKLDINESVQVKGFESVNYLRSFSGHCLIVLQNCLNVLQIEPNKRYVHEINEQDLTYTVRRLR